MKKILLLILIFTQHLAFSAISRNEIVKGYSGGLRYALVPWLKEYVFTKRGTLDSTVDQILAGVVMEVGAKNFEGLDLKILLSSGSDTLRYIASKKLVKLSRYSEAEVLLSQISSESLVYSLAQNFLATISYLKKDYAKSLSLYDECKKTSEKMMSKYSVNFGKKFKINRDICITGKARVLYAQRKFKKADDQYLDLEKKSIVWPPILLEEAWSSYYAGNYNRTLGKLVTYKAPLLRYVSNPEVEVLRAMTYLKMCLYGDVQKVVENFYGDYEKIATSLEREVASKRTPNYYYKKVMGYKNISPKEAMYFYKGIYKSPNIKAYIENISNAKKEFKRLAPGNSQRKKYAQSISEFIRAQKKVIGLLVQTKVNKYAYDLRKSFQAMSYMKLEILGRKKEAVYEDKSFVGKRGDVKFLKRTSKQYFWNFLGEFWGDELGDYVFTLAKECPDDKK